MFVAGALQDALGVVVFVVVVGGALVAVLTLGGTGRLYERIGRGALWMDEADGRSAGPGGPGGRGEASGERDEEIRQLLRARNERRARRGQAPADVESELHRLTGAQADAGLRAEIRQLVVARNERRARRGEEPLDVDAEIDRQVRDLS